MKKKFCVLSSVLGALLLFTACSASVSTSLTANWHTADVQYDPNFSETAVYDVAYNKGNATSNIFELKDFKGTYTVSVSAGHSRPSENGTVSELYKLESTLTYGGTYAKTTGEPVYTFDFGEIKSTVYFHRLGQGYNMQPVYSETNYYICAPGRNSLNTAAVSIAKYDVTISYNADCSQADYKKTDRSADIPQKIKDTVSATALIDVANDVETHLTKLQKSYSYFDNAQLYFVGRGIKFAQNSAETVQTIRANGGDKVAAKFSCTDVANRKCTFTLNEREVDEDVACSEVTFGLNEGNYSGTSYKLFYAAKAEGSANTYRNLLVHFEEPFSYGMGSMAYTLKSVTSSIQ